MNKFKKAIFVISVAGVLTACGQNEAKNDDNVNKTAQEAVEATAEETVKEAEESAEIEKNEVYTSASSAVEMITIEQAVELLSQSSAKTLGLKTDLYEYDIVPEEAVSDLEGIPVYVINVYEKTGTAETVGETTEETAVETGVKKTAGVFYVITDGNAMYRTEFSSGNYINLETGEEIIPAEAAE